MLPNNLPFRFVGCVQALRAGLFALSISLGFPQESCSFGPAPSKLPLRGCLRIFLNDFLLPKIKPKFFSLVASFLSPGPVVFQPLCLLLPCATSVSTLLKYANAMASAPVPLLMLFLLPRIVFLL